MEKNEKNETYNCSICNFICVYKSDWNRHITTRKHLGQSQMEIFGNKLGEKNETTNKCYKCSKIYKTNAGLWKHKQKCVKNINICHTKNREKETDTEKLDIYDLVKYLMKENGELKNIMMNQQNKMMDQQNLVLEIAKNGTHNTTNSHNKAFNLNLFLNETCKDAMNIMDFVDSIKLQLTDLENVGKLGYIEGISNIITTNLKALDVTQRPIHCADKKREVIYIKDEDKWEKEDEQKNKLKKVIHRIACKNQRLISKFKEEHPDCLKSTSNFSDQYNKIIVESMGGSGNNDREKEEKIIKNISKQVLIEKYNFEKL